MNAAYRITYGPPDSLNIRDVERPIPKTNELLVRVRAATVNRTDCGILRGKPYVIRFFTGLIRPKLPITGTDFAGEVVSIGNEVSTFEVGDKIWGFNDTGLQSHAEYLCIAENKAIRSIPEGISFEQAAASAEGAHYAYNFINKVNIKNGTEVMVNGATGAIGSAAVQILKSLGADITASCRKEHFDLVQNLGADKLIDYVNVDFTQDDERYDFVFDAVGKSTFGQCKKILKPGGVYISSELGPGAQNPMLALFTPLLQGKQVKFPLPLDIPRSLKVISVLIEQDQFKAVIDRRYSLEEITPAFQYVESEQKVGNVVINF